MCIRDRCRGRPLGRPSANSGCGTARDDSARPDRLDGSAGQLSCVAAAAHLSRDELLDQLTHVLFLEAWNHRRPVAHRVCLDSCDARMVAGSRVRHRLLVRLLDSRRDGLWSPKHGHSPPPEPGTMGRRLDCIRDFPVRSGQTEAMADGVFAHITTVLDENWRSPARNGLSFDRADRYNSPLAWAGQGVRRD